GPEDQRRDEDSEDDGARPVTPRRVPREALVERLDEPDEDGAQHRAGEVSDPAEHGSGEGYEPELEAAVEANLIFEEEHASRDGCEGSRQEERHRDGPVDVYAHHRRRVGILRDRAHRLPLAGRTDEPGEDGEGGSDDDERDDELPGELDLSDREGVA